MKAIEDQQADCDGVPGKMTGQSMGAKFDSEGMGLRTEAKNGSEKDAGMGAGAGLRIGGGERLNSESCIYILEQ